MKKCTLLLCILLICIEFYCTDGRKRDIIFSPDGKWPDTVTVAFYNVENLFDFVLDGTEYREYRPGAFNWTEEIQQRKVSLTADVIEALEADLMGLCEVENIRVLRELNDTLKNRGAHYPYLSVAKSTSAVTTALMSRFPIIRFRSHPVHFGSSHRYRSILEADVRIEQDSLKLFINHWPSKFNEESSRLKAANILKQRLNSLPENTEYLILGDLNSNYNEHTTFHTEGFNDTRGRTGINYALSTAQTSPDCFTIRYKRPSDMVEPMGRFIHYNLWLELPENERRSYVFRGSGQTLDHFLLPPTLFNTTGFSYLSNSFEVFCWEGQLLRDDVPFRWQMRFRGNQRYHVGEGYSDHLPVRAQFVRHPFTFDSTTIYKPCSLKTVPGVFGSGRDGWVSADTRFKVQRDTSVAKLGKYSLKVSGFHSQRNVSAAKCRFFCSKRAKNASTVQMYIRGTGKLSFRLRGDQQDWIYYNYPDFKPASHPRYPLVTTGSLWKRISLALPENIEVCDSIELEIRAGRAQSFHFNVDGVFLK
ncbi:hypothetical protein QA601_09320 [Chitinispirillales bacterium ANBcel5]|uniref:endonuclease/exonuclease/phosphatase family protein n=1 Tax=Cellulosispirillum alkaliphilum TaxID=3039283 RepID=UPI002A57C582|nr:hypothetical protein [Chitinispirillales bacterium ANBcel5]